MRKIFPKLCALLCIVIILISQSLSLTSLATTSIASGSALDMEKFTTIATGSALDTEIATGPALANMLMEESELPKIQRVVLPTIQDDSYDFTIDVDGLLSQYDSNYTKGDNVYFSSIKNPAQLNIDSSSSNATTSLVVKSKLPNTGLFEYTILHTTVSELETILKQYYVWQTNPDSISDGKWTQLTIDNYTTFFELSADEEGNIIKITYDTEPLADTIENIWDGKIYTITYTEISGEEAAIRFYEEENPTILINETNATLYVKLVDKEGNIAYSEATLTPNTSGSIYYQPATYIHANSSIPAVITNKSTFDISVTAEVHIIDGDELTFCDTVDFNHTSTHEPNIYMALTDGTHEAPVNDNTATASYILKGSQANAIQYLNLSLGSDGQFTGMYHSYLAPLTTYDSVSFELVATLDDRKATEHAWDSYISNLANGIYEKPSIEVIYKFTEVTQDETNPENYITEYGDTYVITDATLNQEDYWVKTVIANSQIESDLLPNTYYSYLIPKRKQS